MTKVDKGFEAFFLRQFLKEARGSSALFGKGFAGETFASMFDEAIADALAQGNTGLSLAPTAAAPVDGKVTSGFGARIDPIDGRTRHHDGVDLAAPLGSPVAAVKAGHVVRAEAAGSYGNLVVVAHPDGTESRYAHLADISVRPGEAVRAGDRLGSVGETGRATGPHLHFELRKQGTAMDPTDIITGLKARSGWPTHPNED